MSELAPWIRFAFPHLPLEKAPSFIAGKATLSDIIVRGVRTALFAAVLNPGDHIGAEASIAEALGVSRMAVRDALRALVAQGIVTVRKGASGGARIAVGEPHLLADSLAVQLRLMGVRLADLLETQIALEAAAAELVAANATPEEVEELRAALARATRGKADPVEFMKGITAFNRLLTQLCRNDALGAMLNSILIVLHDYYGRNTTPRRAEAVLRSYEGLTDAIAANDTDAARVLMRAHLRNVKADIMQSIERGELMPWPSGGNGSFAIAASPAPCAER